MLVQHTILKIDHWSKEALIGSDIEGAANFRFVLDDSLDASCKRLSHCALR